MGEHRRIILWVGLVASCLSLPACREEPPPPPGSWASEPAPVVTTKVDVADPDELAEGKERAFDFPVPRAMRVEARFEDAVYLVGRVPFASLNNYIRERVVAGEIDTGPAKTVYGKAALKNGKKRLLELTVSNDYGNIELIVRDRTRTAVEKGLTEEQRWKRAGLTQEGQVIEKSAE